MPGQITEETAQALMRSMDAMVARLGEVIDQQGEVVGQLQEHRAALLRRQESFDSLSSKYDTIADALKQLADKSLPPELVRVAASLNQVTPKLPELEYIAEGLAQIVALRDELRPLIASLDQMRHSVLSEIEEKLQALRVGAEGVRERQVQVEGELLQRNQQIAAQSDLFASLGSDVQELLMESIRLAETLQTVVRWAREGRCVGCGGHVPQDEEARCTNCRRTFSEITMGDVMKGKGER